MKKNQSGFGVVECIFILLTVSLIGLASWYVYHKQSVKERQSTSAPTARMQENANKNDISIYKNDILGLSFSYPTRWGAPITKTRDNNDRSVSTNGYTEFDITFPNAPLFILPIINNKNNYLVQYAGCFNTVGFLELAKSQDPSLFKPNDWKQSETATGNNYTTYSKVVVGNNEMTLVENFEVSTTVNPQDYCNGLSVYGSQKIDTNTKNITQVQFLWSKTASTFGKDQPKLNLKDLDDFKNNPTKYISNQDLADIQTTVEAIKTY